MEDLIGASSTVLLHVTTYYYAAVYAFTISLFLFFTSSYGLAHVGRVGSVLLTLSVTIERYYSVCHPLRVFRPKKLSLIHI